MQGFTCGQILTLHCDEYEGLRDSKPFVGNCCNSHSELIDSTLERGIVSLELRIERLADESSEL